MINEVIIDPFLEWIESTFGEDPPPGPEPESPYSVSETTVPDGRALSARALSRSLCLHEVSERS